MLPCARATSDPSPSAIIAQINGRRHGCGFPHIPGICMTTLLIGLLMPEHDQSAGNSNKRFFVYLEYGEPDRIGLNLKTKNSSLLPVRSGIQAGRCCTRSRMTFFAG